MSRVHSLARALATRTRRVARAGSLCAMVAVAGMWACVPTPQVAPVSTALSGNDVVLDARLLQMTDARRFDSTLVDEMLADRDPARRARAALAIGQVKGRARYPRLRQLLVDADTGVAANAAFALGLAKDTSAIVPLARAVAGAPDAVAIEAAWSLGDIGDPARAVLTLALGEGQGQPLSGSTAAQRSAPVRAALITATSKLRNPPVAVLLPWLNDGDVTVVRATAYVLGRTRAAGGVRAMLALRSSPDEETRQHVARVLGKGAAGDSLGPRALEALTALLADTSARVRANVVRSLATFGPTARTPLLRALRDADGNVRVATAEVIAPILGSDSAAWRNAWAADTTLPVRVALLANARRAGVRVLASEEERWIKAPDWQQRVAVLQARSADTGRPVKLADIGWALRDPDGRVRDAAINNSREIARADRVVPDTLRKVWAALVTDPDVQVRASVIAALAPTANAAELPRVLDAYMRATNESDNEVRMAALAYVSSAWQRDSARVDAALRQRLSALPVPRDSLERRAPRSVTPLAAWRTAATADATRPLAEYEALVRRYVVAGAHPVGAVIHTARGDISLALYGREAPLTVDNFVALARRGYYRDTRFHRVVPNFVAQDGDSRGDGSGGPGYAIRDELNRTVHTRGALAMALSGPDTGGSQYYLCHSPQPHLDGHYTVFGHITQGYDVLDRIVQGDRILSIEIR